MNFAWVIDQTRCIGCHACSTACKSENDVPLGVYRTWVKNVEVGTFPNVRRHFAVLRCNHCADPPCVPICPVGAMFQRSDGIVDIDHDRCIGCKACMQACPYEAIHIDPTDQTAAKCHFCAHRVDRGLLPACVVVCPVEALIFGDLDDPGSRVAHLLGRTPATVRRPEQNTRPKAFYLGAHAATLDPLAAHHETSYMWADRTPGTARDHSADFSVWAGTATSTRPTGTDHSNQRRSGQSRLPTARVAYDVGHQIPWRGRVSAYLWTKSLAAGTGFIAAVILLLRAGGADTLTLRVAPLASLVALGVTGILLITDLKQPARFWYILAYPQWRSWLTRGTIIITAYGILLTAWLLMGIAGRTPGPFLLPGILAVAFATAVYTAFLFGQCEGRDLWQSPVVGLALTAQMVVAGSAGLLLLGMALGIGERTMDILAASLLLGLAGHLLTVFLGEITARHGSSNARAAARALTHGSSAGLFWTAVIPGALLPMPVLAAVGPHGAPAVVAALAALAGLWAYEHAFVMAGQSVPLS